VKGREERRAGFGEGIGKDKGERGKGGQGEKGREEKGKGG